MSMAKGRREKLKWHWKNINRVMSTRIGTDIIVARRNIFTRKETWMVRNQNDQ
jgi:hypothetical protein